MAGLKEIKEFRDRLRRRVWEAMMREGVARFPLPTYGRIPNFIGAEVAARRLAATREFLRAEVVKVSPDSPQRPVREEVLRRGKRLVMPTPRIREGFLLIDPAKIPRGAFGAASTIRGAFRYGIKVKPWNLPEVDLIVTGSVAVDLSGTRLGKGRGYSELEYGILLECGKVSTDTPVFTTVHDIQVLEDVEIPRLPWDVTVDKIFTPTRGLSASGPKQRPPGILWEYVRDRVNEIPLLMELRRRVKGG